MSIYIYYIYIYMYNAHTYILIFHQDCYYVIPSLSIFVPPFFPASRTGNHGTVQLPIACADHWPRLGDLVT